jgi:hypothetical protein
VRDLRILCLHGYHGSGAVLRRQMVPLAAALPPNVKLDYVDAPSLSAGDFGWWHHGFSGWQRSRDWAVELLRSGPRFDGVFGFSQGAVLTGLLAAIRENGTAPVEFDIDFVLMVGGFTSNEPQHAELFRHKLAVPSVHVIGQGDVVVPRRESLLLADRFADPLVIEHPGGHVIPGDSAVAGPIVEFLSRFAHPGATADAGHREVST